MALISGAPGPAQIGRDTAILALDMGAELHRAHESLHVARVGFELEAALRGLAAHQPASAALRGERRVAHAEPVECHAGRAARELRLDVAEVALVEDELAEAHAHRRQLARVRVGSLCHARRALVEMQPLQVQQQRHLARKRIGHDHVAGNLVGRRR